MQRLRSSSNVLYDKHIFNALPAQTDDSLREIRFTHARVLFCVRQDVLQKTATVRRDLRSIRQNWAGRKTRWYGIITWPAQCRHCPSLGSLITLSFTPQTSFHYLQRMPYLTTRYVLQDLNKTDAQHSNVRIMSRGQRWSAIWLKTTKEGDCKICRRFVKMSLSQNESWYGRIPTIIDNWILLNPKDEHRFF